MAVKAEAFLWIKLFLPLRIALNAEDIDLRCLDMNEYYTRIADLLLLWSTEDITRDGLRRFLYIAYLLNNSRLLSLLRSDCPCYNIEDVKLYNMILFRMHMCVCRR